ncbi:choice-of-anchor D domain-containing protein [Fulvivirga sp. RKSG066]|nr:choice-of-anchor D domain-containing protein [Fulvivirga aurantia]
MNNHYSQWKSYVLPLFLVLITSLSSLAQTQQGIVRIKLTEEKAAFMEQSKMTRSDLGYVRTGDAGLDMALSTCKANNMTRVFRPAGRFEAKHRKHGLHLWYEIKFDKSTKVSTAVSAFANLADVQVSEPVYEKEIIGIDREALNARVRALASDPNDPQYGSQWHYENTGQTGGTVGADISCPEAWSLETGKNEVIVAVTDGGIDVAHEDLAANMWVNTGEIPGNGVDDDGNGYVDDINGYGFGDNSGTIPADFHGTHVGGTVAAVTNNGVGVAGVAGGDGSGDGVRLMSCAAFGQFNVGGFAESYTYGADMGAVISQNSWGYTSPNVFEQAVLDAIDYFIAEAGFDEFGNPNGTMQGGIVIFAAGNDGTDDQWYPGIYEPIVAVGGTDHNDDEYVFSNRGDWVDVAAPAVNVFSTLPGNSYGNLTGTSMACPHVSGVAGLIISQNLGSLTPTQVRARIEQTADPLPGLEFLGTGRVNAFAALQQDDGQPPLNIDDLSVDDKDLSSVTLGWTAPADPGNGSATSYELRYATFPLNASNFNAGIEAPGVPNASVAGTPEVFKVKGLSPSTQYYFAIKSADFFGNVSGISNVVNATTDDPPVAGVDPSSLFSNLTTGESEVQNLTISNTGDGPLEFDISLGGTVFTPSGAVTTTKNIKPHSKLLSSTKAYVSSDVAPLAGDQYATGFESMSLGDIDGQEGWSAGLQDWNVSNANPYSGSNHLRAESAELAPGTSFSLAFSPNVGVGSEEYSSTSAKLSVDNNGTSWQYIPQSPSAEFIVTRVSFDADGSISVYDGDVGDFVALSATVPTGYFDLKLVVHRANFDMNLFINNELVYVGKAVTGDIEQVVLLSPMEQNGNLFMMDDMSIYDGELDTFPFLSISPDSGEVPPNSDQVVAVTFDAAGLFGGTYENEILIKTNDPANPSFNVPATLNVTGTGKPVISVDPTSVSFPDTFVGGASTADVEIANEGTEILVVSDLTTVGDFNVIGNTSFNILPFQSETVTLEFAPTALGLDDGALIISNNDTDNTNYEVSLTGEGVEAPQISVDPASFTVELEEGASTTETMTITNNGVADLEFSIETSEASSASTTSVAISPVSKIAGTSAATKQKQANSFAGRTATFDAKLSSSTLNVLILTPDEDVTDLGATLSAFSDLNVSIYPKASLPGISLADLTPFDVVMTTNNTQWLASGSVDPAVVGDLLADYIDQGGKVVANCFAYDYDAWSLAGRFIDEQYGPFTGTTTDFFGSTSLGTVHAPDHPIMDGVVSIGNDYLWQNPSLAPGATHLADWNDGNVFAAANDNVVALNILPSDGNGIPGWSGDLPTLYHNAIVWLSGSGFISTDVESGVLAQGESVEVQVTISAASLDAGLYSGSIDISSNDPTNAILSVPVELTVLGPVIDVNPEEMEVTVIKGLSESRTLTISNNGSVDAEFVIDIVNSSPDAGTSMVVDNSPPRINAFAGSMINYAAAVEKVNVSSSAAGDEVYSTGFENFSVGNINGQQGWTGQFGNWRVESDDPKSGNNHFQGLSDGLGQSVAYTPQLSMAGEAVTSASMDVYLEEGASWWISTESTLAINGRIIFDPDGNVVVVSDDGIGGANLDTLAYTIPSDYFNLAFEVDKTSGNFKLFINSTEVFEGKAFSTDIEFVVVLSLMETFGPVFNMDNVNVYEGRYVPEFITLSQEAGIIPVGSSVDIEVNFDGSKTPFGTYYRDLHVLVNGGSEPEAVVATTFNVTGDAAIEVTPQVLEQVVNYQESENREFLIKNTGGQSLDFSISVLGADLAGQDMAFAQSTRAEIGGAKYEQYMAHRTEQPSVGGVTQLMVGETLFEEDFDGGTFPPTGWSVIDNEGSGLQWDVLSVHGMENWCGSGDAASVNSDANQGVEFDTELHTPVIDIEGRTGIAVQYNVNYINFIGLDFLDLDVTTDNGATWTNVLRWNESHGSFFTSPGELVTLELDDYVAGASSMQLRWRYYDPNSGDWDYYVQIDDVKIMADANAWLTVSPSAGIVPVGQNLPVQVTFDASKVDPDEYFAGILVNSNASNAPVASVFAIMEVLEPAEIEVNPSSMEELLVSGFSSTQTLSITNNGESVLRYNLGGFAKDAKVVSVSKKPADRIITPVRSDRYDGELYQGIEAIVVDRSKRSASMPVYGTDFESFAPGDIDGQDGWFAQYGNWTIESDTPESGLQHFRGLSDGLGQSVAITPNVGIGSEATSSFSTDVKVDGTGVTWQMIPQSTTAELVVTRLQVNPDGSVDALIDDGAGNPVFDQVSPALPTGYFKLMLEVDRTTAVFNIYVDGTMVYTGQGFAGDIEEIVILSLMEASGPTMDLDDMNIWDGLPPVPFISTNPEFGNVASGETVEIEVTFDASNLEKGIYTDEIIVFNNDPDNPEVVIPVTLEVINPPALEVDPESIESFVLLGTTKDHTVTITNTGEANLRFGFAGFGEAPTPGVFAQTHTELSDSQLSKQQKDDAGSRPQTYAKPVTFMEGEQILFEGFEGDFPPAGWSVVDNEGNGVVWESSDSNYTGGSGKSALADSDAAGTLEYDTELITPVIDVDGKTGVVVQYYVNYQNFLNNDFLDVDITTDGGTSWTNVLSWNEDHGSLRNLPGEFVSLELDDYISGAESMQLRWHYYNPNTGDFDWYAQIDEVEIIYAGVQWLTLDPGQGVIGEGESLEVTVTFDATEVEPGTYNKELLLLTNVPDEPEKVLNMTMHAVIIEDLELASTCSDNPDEQRRWEVNNPNAFEVDAFWFVVGSAEGDSITMAPGVNYFYSPTQTDRPNTVKVKWLDHTGATQEAVSESSGLPCLVEDLNLTSVCSNNPDLFRRWRVRNPNPFVVMVNWYVVGTSQSGILYAEGDSDTFFFTEAIPGSPNTTKIVWIDENGDEQEKVKASGGEICDIDNSCYGGEVIAFDQGLRKKGTIVPPRRSIPENALGLPEENDEINFVSLGIGGSLVIKLNSIVVDQPGNDFMVVETSFNDVGDPCETYPEMADVYVSIDGESFYLLGTACKDTEFDIATSGLLEIEYVKFVDVTDVNANHIGPAADGFDVDGIYCINAHYSAAVQRSFGEMANVVADEESEELVAFPNPFREQIAVKSKVEKEGRYIIRVHDIFGSLVAEQVVIASHGQIEGEINAVNISRGTYTVTVISEDESYRSSHILIKN